MRKYIQYILLMLPLFMASCHKDDWGIHEQAMYQGDGRIVDVTLSYGSSESNIVTKALSDESERQVTDIFIYGFPVTGVDVGGNPIFNDSRPAFKQYFPREEILAASEQAGHYNSGAVGLKNLPTGSYVFVGVANVVTSEYGGDELLEDLSSVDTWSDYTAISAALNTKASVDRISPALLMSGFYRPTDYTGDHRRLTPVEITNQAVLPGYIHLVRVDARVKFVITNAVSRVKSFKLESWQVMNVPDDVMLYTNSLSTPSAVSNSSVFTAFTSRDTEHSFEFYIPEYVFTSSDASLDEVKKREKRNLDDSWMYAPQDAPYVVFTGKIEMLVDDSETGETDVNRYADVKFTVHLGGCEGGSAADKAKDFKTDRNTKYTYNIVVNGVNDIVVEAKRTSGVEYNHGFEGVVIDNVGGLTYNFDSHYGVANIALSKNDLKKMSITLSSIVGEQKFSRDNVGTVIFDNLDNHSEDFQAFRFAFEPVSSEFAYKSYPVQLFTKQYVSYSKTYDAGKYIEVLHNEVSQAKDANHTVALYDLRSMLECLPFGDGGDAYKDQSLIDHMDVADAYRIAHPGSDQYETKDDIPVIFTVFVNENVYYNDVSDWHEHANTVDRVLRMFTSAALSTDGKSEYIRGRYNFDQKYCQTYYSDINNEALCVEFVNEHHHKDIKNTKGTNPGAGKSVKSGWQYVNAELSGKAWEACASQETPLCDHYNAFSTLYAANGVYAKQIPGSSDSNDYEAVYASLSRNRDLNRNGVIESNELKWFLASMEQYIQITVGGTALARKIFTPDDYYNWDVAEDGAKGDIFGNVRFHFCGVETNSKFWAEEGYTVGDQSVAGVAESSSGWRSNPWELLCCRMLVDHSRIHEEETHWNDFEDLYYYSNREKNVISMDKYRSNLHRQAVSGWIDLHTNDNDVANSTFTHFQYAKNDAAIVDRNPGELVLLDRMHLNSYCNDYSEASDGSDRGTWRVPNQRETAVMRYLGGINNATQPNGGAYYLSCSTWPFPSSGQRTYQGRLETVDFCTVGMNPTKSSPSGQLSQNYLRVRCVRDTDKDGNFVGKPEFGNPVNFQAGTFTCNYNGDLADYNITATMDAAVVASVNVTIDGITASNTGSGTLSSSVHNATVNKSSVEVVWTITTTSGKTLTYRKTCNLPARYWLISNYATQTRYAYVNTETNRTAVGTADSRDVNEISAEYKWVFTTTPGGSPVNVNELQPETTYYMYNAGSQSYISSYSNNSSFMGVGGTAIPVKLVLRSGYDGYYVIRVNNSTNINKNGGDDKFGTWTGVDNGSTYKLTPSVLRGPMPLSFEFAPALTSLSPGCSAAATVSPDAEVLGVTIDGQTAVVSGSAGSYSAHISSAVSDEYTIPVVWTIRHHGETITKTKFYSLKSYWAFRDRDRNEKAVTVSGGLSVLRNESLDDAAIPSDCKWLLLLPGDETKTNQTPAIPTNGSYLAQHYILYNVGTGMYLGTSTNGTNNADNFTMVSDISQALELELGGNANGSLWRVRVNGATGFFDRRTDMTIGVNGGLRHAWYFKLVNP